MEFTVRYAAVNKLRSPCLVVGVFEPHALSPAARALDKACQGHIVTVLKRGDMRGKIGQTLLLHDLPKIAAARVLLIGCGKEADLDETKFRKIIGHATAALRDIRVREAVSCLTELEVKGRDAEWKVRQTVEQSRDALYRFRQLKTTNNDRADRLQRMTITVPARGAAAGRRAVRIGQAIANGVTLAKDLGNLPANICTPSYLARRAVQLAKTDKRFKVRVLDEKEMRARGMGALLAVARGSRQPPRLITLRYLGGRGGERPYVLVGKGITFDSGGISIKPAQAMDEMKYDMCGAASVLGTLAAVSELQLPVNVIGIVPSCENLPDGNASRPGDIVTSMSGQTIEVLNTDAEGRLILCDALTYCQRFKPAAVIDVATLTGACVIALGKHPSGLLGNDDALINQLRAAGAASGDRVWQLPLWEEYQEQLDSGFADMTNVGGREAGTITGACFLARFVKDQRWAHLDIAGTAWQTGAKKGATGRPVPLLTQFLIDRSHGEA